MTRQPLTLSLPTAPPPPPRIFLNAGDFHFGAAPLQLETLLGPSTPREKKIELF